jgi:hypothetical protein
MLQGWGIFTQAIFWIFLIFSLCILTCYIRCWSPTSFEIKQRQVKTSENMRMEKHWVYKKKKLPLAEKIILAQ